MYFFEYNTSMSLLVVCRFEFDVGSIHKGYVYKKKNT